MRVQTTSPTNPTPQRFHINLTTDVSNSHGLPRHRGAHPTPSTTVDMAHIAVPIPSQRPMPASARTRDWPHAQSYPQVPGQPRATLDAAEDTQTPGPTFPPSPYSQMFHAPATTAQWWSEPPPLDFSKPPHRCIPLPQTTPEPATLNPILAYTNRHTAQDELNVSQRWPVDVHQHHICAPATNPSVGSATILLPNGRGITVHAWHRGHSFVTVGDMLDALDTMLLGKPSRELSLPVEVMRGGPARSCPCLSATTTLHSLRRQYGRAGFTRSEEGFDIWDLRIG